MATESHSGTLKSLSEVDGFQGVSDKDRARGDDGLQEMNLSIDTALSEGMNFNSGEFTKDVETIEAAMNPEKVTIHENGFAVGGRYTLIASLDLQHVELKLFSEWRIGELQTQRLALLGKPDLRQIRTDVEVVFEALYLSMFGKQMDSDQQHVDKTDQSHNQTQRCHLEHSYRFVAVLHAQRTDKDVGGCPHQGADASKQRGKAQRNQQLGGTDVRLSR